jgi:hypothetical protein
MKKYVFSFLFSVSAMVLIIVSCSKDKSNDNGTTTLQIRLTDGPTNLAEVNVDIKEINVKFNDDSTGSKGWVSMPTNAGVYNLLGLQNGVDTLLASLILPKDILKEIRFVLGSNNSIKDTFGVVYPLTIPSGSESGLKIKVSKKLSATLETLLIDFDAALSVKREGNGDYKLRPVLKIK